MMPTIKGFFFLLLYIAAASQADVISAFQSQAFADTLTQAVSRSGGKLATVSDNAAYGAAIKRPIGPRAMTSAADAPKSSADAYLKSQSPLLSRSNAIRRYPYQTSQSSPNLYYADTAAYRSPPKVPAKLPLDRSTSDNSLSSAQASSKAPPIPPKIPLSGRSSSESNILSTQSTRGSSTSASVYDKRAELQRPLTTKELQEVLKGQSKRSTSTARNPYSQQNYNARQSADDLLLADKKVTSTVNAPRAGALVKYGGQTWTRIKSADDGNCQFTSIGNAIGKSQMEVRKMVAAEIRKSDKQFARTAILTQAGDVQGDKMVRYIEKSGDDIRPAWADAVENGAKLNGPKQPASIYWGDESTMAFISKAIPGRYIQYVGPGYTKPRVPESGSLTGRQPITLEFQPHSQHYNLLLPASQH